MRLEVKAIFFDIGGTLVEKSTDPERDLSVIERMVHLLNMQCTPVELMNKISAGESEYKSWRNTNLVELSPEERWSRFLLRDHPGEFVRQHAIQLQTLWSDSKGKKWVDPKVVTVIRELASRGYILGTISHTSPKYLREAGIAELFKVTVHSAEFGRRKPHPSLFLEAARQCDVAPGECAYVGDKPTRDVTGPREAGIGTVILLQHGTLAAEKDPCPMQPDLFIQHINQLLDIFPQRSAYTVNRKTTHQPELLYDASLSTMWWNKEVDSAEDFFSKGRKLGFARFELNHQVPPEVFDSIDLKHYSIGSLHDPCPAVVPSKQLEQMDVQITSLDEGLRTRGVDVVKSTIEKAYQLNAREVVIHPGRIVGDHSMDDQLRALYRSGLKGSSSYEKLKETLIADRLERGKPHLSAAMKSLEEIISFAESTGLLLGLENRFHYYELPILNELDTMLAAFQQPWVGWQLDVGHLQVYHALGLVEFQEWLERFSSRMIGVHLHDVQGIVDHRIPGSGDVDFTHLSAYLPAHVVRTLEIDKSVSFDEFRTGLELLSSAGCIKQI